MAPPAEIPAPYASSCCQGKESLEGPFPLHIRTIFKGKTSKWTFQSQMMWLACLLKRLEKQILFQNCTEVTTALIHFRLDGRGLFSSTKCYFPTIQCYSNILKV